MKLFSYIAEIFSPGNGASFGRWATAATVATGCWAMVHLVRQNHALPDAIEIAALSAWMIAPYSVNKFAAAFPTNPQPSAAPNS